MTSAIFSSRLTTCDFVEGDNALKFQRGGRVFNPRSAIGIRPT